MCYFPACVLDGILGLLNDVVRRVLIKGYDRGLRLIHCEGRGECQERDGGEKFHGSGWGGFVSRNRCCWESIDESTFELDNDDEIWRGNSGAKKTLIHIKLSDGAAVTHDDQSSSVPECSEVLPNPEGTFTSSGSPKSGELHAEYPDLPAAHSEY